MSQSLISRQAALYLHLPTLKPRLGSSRLSSSLLVRTLRLHAPGALKSTIGGGIRTRKTSVTMAALPGLFPHPNSTLLYVMEFFFTASGPLQTYNEATGKNNMSYSKFAGLDGRKRAMIPSKRGFFLFYFPAAVISSVFLAYRVGVLPLASVLDSVGASGVASFLQQPVASSDDRLLLVAAALCIHFLKRCLEVLYVHKFSGSVSVGDAVVITQSYTSQACLLYSQMLSAGFEAPSPDLKWLGVAIFLIGITGNAYHHWILAQLRKDGNKKYVVPHGGLFDLFVCPHYIFEMLDFVGMALISQTVFSWCMASFTIFYLTGRSMATKQWYRKKVEGFPEDRSVLIPGIF